MKVALYIGDHKDDTLTVRAGWALTRLVQKGEFANVTHVEAIHTEHKDGSVDIASASIREGGVSVKEKVFLNPRHWLIVEVPKWSVRESRKWFIEHNGQKYDIRGAFASALPIQWTQPNRWFCNHSIAEPFLKSAWIFGPAQFAAIVMSIGEDVTAEFFRARYASF